MYSSTVLALPVESRVRSHVLEVFECDGVDTVTVECPACEASGYAEGRVCSECFGLGDITSDDLEEVVEILNRWA